MLKVRICGWFIKASAIFASWYTQNVAQYTESQNMAQ